MISELRDERYRSTALLPARALILRGTTSETWSALAVAFVIARSGIDAGAFGAAGCRINATTAILQGHLRPATVMPERHNRTKSPTSTILPRRAKLF